MRWLHTWWLTVPEPRVFSLGWGIAYAVLCLTGLAALYDPPVSVVKETSLFVVQLSIGGLNITGTLIAMSSGYFDFWKGERLGIGLAAGAALVYAGLLLYLKTSGDASPLVSLGYVAFSAVVLGIRYLMIRWYTFRPRG